MSLFKGIKDNWKKAEAAAIIQTLLEGQARVGTFSGDPATAANTLVKKAWAVNPEILDGRYGQRPHKASLAATALAMAVDGLSRDSKFHGSLITALAQILLDLEEKGFLLPLSQLDQKLLATAQDILIRESELVGFSELDQELSGALRNGKARLSGED